MEETFYGHDGPIWMVFCPYACWNICILEYESFDWVTSELMRSAANEAGP